MSGIVRKTDELGRIVIPIEVRRELGIGVKDPLEIYVHKDEIVLKKYQHQCVLCGSGEDLIEYKNKKICKQCIAGL